MQDFKYVACAPPACSCPVIEVEFGTVFITDDFDRVVTMTPDQMALIARRFLQVYETGAYSNEL